MTGTCVLHFTCPGCSAAVVFYYERIQNMMHCVHGNEQGKYIDYAIITMCGLVVVLM